MAENAAPFGAVYELDPADETWLARVEGLDGCHSYGRTKQEAAERIEEALAVWLDCEPSEFTLTHA